MDGLKSNVIHSLGHNSNLVSKGYNLSLAPITGFLDFIGQESNGVTRYKLLEYFLLIILGPRKI